MEDRFSLAKLEDYQQEGDDQDPAGTQQERGALQLAGEYQEPAGRVPQEQVQGALQLVGGRHQPAAGDAQHRLGLLEVDVCQESDEPIYCEDNYPANYMYLISVFVGKLMEYIIY